MSTEEEKFYQIAKDIVKVFGKIFATRPYIAIIDANGNIHYIDEILSKQHLEFIQDFVKVNFKYMKVGEYSVPLGSINLAFFKISSKALITIFTEKGFTGQLLAFKTRMYEWSEKIDNVLGTISIPSTIVAKESQPVESIKPSIVKKKTGIRKIPLLTKNLTGKEKFSIEASSIIQFIDGKRSVDEICDETKYPKLKVNQVLIELQKKGMIKFKKFLA